MKSVTHNQEKFVNQELSKNNTYDSPRLYSDKFSVAYKLNAEDLYKQHKVPRLKRRLAHNWWE